MKKALIAGVASLILGGAAEIEESAEELKPSAEQALILAQKFPQSSNQEAYETILQEIKEKQAEFARCYNRGEKGTVEESRRFVLDRIVNSLFPAWYGTPWDFYGNTQTPQQGKIACGYFVSTILQHAGFKVERVAMAQEPAENIIKTLTTDIKRYSQRPITEFVEDTKKRGEGLYVLGLDIHVGFLVNGEVDGVNDLHFCHSSYYAPYEVVCERAITSGPIRDSQYRVAGKILGSQMMQSWLRGDNFRTVRNIKKK